MKASGKPLTIFYTALCAAALLFTSCKKETAPAPLPGGGSSGGGHTDNSGGLVTPPGTNAGTPETFTMGAAGGSFSTADGRLTIGFQPQTLNDNTTFTVQPITNQTPGAAGIAYRISPHVAAFTKPVTLSFHYSSSDTLNSMQDALAIAYQDDQGIWQAVGSRTVDTVAKTVTINTTHFSDWSLFKMLMMSPSMAFVSTGGHQVLNVIRTVDLQGGIVDIPNPSIPVKDSLAADIREWKLAGAGSLSSNGSHADYSAPSSIPAVNPVAVSATLNTGGSRKIILVANLYIGGEGISFRVDGGPWISGPCPLGAVTTSGITIATAVPMVNNAPLGSISLKWKGHQLLENIPWSLDFPEFSYSPGSTINYWHFYVQGGNAHPSPGGIFFNWYGDTGDYINGTFLLDKSGRSYTANNTTTWDVHRIEGFFHVKRGN